MTYYLILALAAIVFYVLLFFAAKNWHWLDITALALMFPALLIFFTLTMMLLGTYNNHRTVYENHISMVETQLRDNQLLRDGWATSATGEIDHEETWLTKVREELGRSLFDRGRVWRNCFRGDFDGTTLTVITAQWGDERCTGADLPNVIPAADPGAAGEAAAEAPAAAGPQAARPHGIEEKMVLYLFAETPLAQLDPPVREAILAGISNAEQLDVRGQICTVPTVYLGEFTVTGSQPESIALQPMIPLSESQIAVLNDPQSTWSLLEMMPVDSRQAFEDLSEDNKRSLFPEPLVDEYIRDGQLADRDSDPRERTMVRIRFKEPYNQIVVDAADEPPLLPSSDFNTLGQAVPAWLRHGGEGELAGRIEFQVGDVALFDVETAQQLITEEIAEEVDRVYVRQLWDYEFLFHKLYRQSTIVEDKNAVTRQDIARIEGAKAKTLQSVKYREAESANLEHDKTGFEHERDQITRYHGSLDKRYRETLQQLSTLYQESLMLAEQLNAESKLVEGIVNARSREGGVLIQP